MWWVVAFGRPALFCSTKCCPFRVASTAIDRQTFWHPLFFFHLLIRDETLHRYFALDGGCDFSASLMARRVFRLLVEGLRHEQSGSDAASGQLVALQTDALESEIWLGSHGYSIYRVWVSSSPGGFVSRKAMSIEQVLTDLVRIPTSPLSSARKPLTQCRRCGIRIIIAMCLPRLGWLQQTPRPRLVEPFLARRLYIHGMNAKPTLRTVVSWPCVAMLPDVD